MATHVKMGIAVILLVVGVTVIGANGNVSESCLKQIVGINKEGPFLGIVVPNAYEMGPLLQSPSFVPHQKLPYLDISGRRFRFGVLENQTVIVVMTGLSMLNAGITTQLLVTLFDVGGVVHYGIAGNVNPSLQIGDVTIPQYWAHMGLWNWQKYGDGPEDELALEPSGDYTRRVGYLNISGYGDGTNLLNNVWYQPEEIFPIHGVPELRQHALWIPADQDYYVLSAELKDLNLSACVNTTCLPRSPVVVRVERGISANIFLSNDAYRQFLHSKFNVTTVDMETAAIALVCHQQGVPYIAIRSLSGGSSSVSGDAATFVTLAAQNAVEAVIRFVALLGS